MNNFIATLFVYNTDRKSIDLHKLLSMKISNNIFTSCHGELLNDDIAINGFSPLIEFTVHDEKIENFCNIFASELKKYIIWIQCYLINDNYIPNNDENVENKSICAYEYRYGQLIYSMEGGLFSGLYSSFDDSARRNIIELNDRCKSHNNNPIIYLLDDGLLYYRHFFDDGMFIAIDGNINIDQRTEDNKDRQYYIIYNA